MIYIIAALGFAMIVLGALAISVGLTIWHERQHKGD